MSFQRRMRVINKESDAMSCIKIAFASSDMTHVDQHFGAARSFAVYNVDPRGSALLEAIEFAPAAQDGNEDKLVAKIGVLAGCAAVYCQAVGSSAVRQLLAQGIQPVKVSEGARIKDLITAMQEELRQGPSAWLAKAINQQTGPDVKRFDQMESDGWDE
ncbi:MAG: nitrogen fixation protein NifX [Pseudomonadota bacterium]